MSTALKAMEPVERRLLASDKTDWEYITIPDWDYIEEKAHPPLSINFVSFSPGTHLVPPDIAGELKRMINNYRVSRLRIMNPRIDQKGANLASTMFGGPQGMTAVDPAKLQ